MTGTLYMWMVIIGGAVNENLRTASSSIVSNTHIFVCKINVRFGRELRLKLHSIIFPLATSIDSVQFMNKCMM